MPLAVSAGGGCVTAPVWPPTVLDPIAPGPDSVSIPPLDPAAYPPGGAPPPASGVPGILLGATDDEGRLPGGAIAVCPAGVVGTDAEPAAPDPETVLVPAAPALATL
ncbi:MAG: hypothetical protein GY815_12975 [Gammaproteobacteria bacterium]|nr:hypothetical protein [Gammaproteobacteria bacterium]